MEIASISYGPYLLYANFLHEGGDSLLLKPLLQLVKEAIISEEDDNLENFDKDYDSDGNGNGDGDGNGNVGAVPLDMESLTELQLEDIKKLEKKSYIELDVLVEDTETGEEVELPPVRVVRRTRRQ